MASMIINHRISDYNLFRSVFDSLHATMNNYGETGEEVSRGDKQPNDIVIITNWGSLDQAKKYSQSREIKDAFKKAGISNPNIYFVD